MCVGASAGRWLVCANCLFLWVDGLLRHASVACGATIIGYWYLVVGGVWLTQSVGVRWCIVGCLGWHMVVVPGPATCGCCFVVALCGVGVLCENWIVDASNLFFLYFVWFILTPSHRQCFVCVVG